MIYEGTNGIQALDLVGRKLPSQGGRAIMSWFADIDAFVAENGADGPSSPSSTASPTPRPSCRTAPSG
jgi:hypothetical protein